MGCSSATKMDECDSLLRVVPVFSNLNFDSGYWRMGPDESDREKAADHSS